MDNCTIESFVGLAVISIDIISWVIIYWFVIKRCLIDGDFSLLDGLLFIGALLGQGIVIYYLLLHTNVLEKNNIIDFLLFSIKYI